MKVPGTYKNKRNETVVLIESEISDLLKDENGNYYNRVGTRMDWHSGLERFVMSTDSGDDICIVPEMSNKVRLDKLSQARSLIREVEFSYALGDHRRRRIYALLVSIDWSVAIDHLEKELKCDHYYIQDSVCCKRCGAEKE